MKILDKPTVRTPVAKRNKPSAPSKPFDASSPDPKDHQQEPNHQLNKPCRRLTSIRARTRAEPRRRALDQRPPVASATRTRARQLHLQVVRTARWMADSRWTSIEMPVACSRSHDTSMLYPHGSSSVPRRAL